MDRPTTMHTGRFHTCTYRMTRTVNQKWNRWVITTPLTLLSISWSSFFCAQSTKHLMQSIAQLVKSHTDIVTAQTRATLLFIRIKDILLMTHTWINLCIFGLWQCESRVYQELSDWSHCYMYSRIASPPARVLVGVSCHLIQIQWPLAPTHDSISPGFTRLLWGRTLLNANLS